MFEKGLKTAEQIISSALKDVCGIKESTNLKISTLGKPVQVQIGPQKEERKITTETLFSLKKKHDLPECVVDSGGGLDGKNSNKVRVIFYIFE